MKLIYKVLGAGLVIGALLLAGCASATSSDSAPDISTASGPDSAKYQKAFDGLSAGSPDGTDLPSGITISGSFSDPSAIDATLTYTNYSTDDGETVINGTINVKGSFVGGTSTVKETGTLTVSGTGGVTGTVVFALTMTTTSSNSTIKGSVTVDGTKYSIDETFDFTA